jgi:hypothetical protein
MENLDPRRVQRYVHRLEAETVLALVERCDRLVAELVGTVARLKQRTAEVVEGARAIEHGDA